MGTTQGPGSGEKPIDWEAIEHSPEFQELIARKRRFVVPAVIFFLGYYTLFILLAGYAEGFMGERIYEGLTVGYVLALTQFLMVWVLTWMYLRKAKRDFDPLEHAAVEHLREQAQAEATARDERARTGRVAPTGGTAAEEARR